MSQPSTAREALIAEALGDIAHLLDRVEALAPSMEATRKTLDQANVAFAHQISAFEARVAATLEQGKTRTAEHITHHIERVGRQSLAQQSQAMTDSARAIFIAEIGTTLHRVAASLHTLAERVERAERPWRSWLAHVATAAVAVATTIVLTVYPPI
jgi:nitrate reductase assembly molybdenum cofactor insertion protein NarJ